ncbi:hypothetical protein ACVW1A_001479 [Bradyrhizobium sp. LB1.3]
MWRQWIPFWQPGLSPHAGDVDLLFAGLLIMSALVLGLSVLPACAVLRPLPRRQPDRPRPSRRERLALGSRLDRRLVHRLPRPLHLGFSRLFSDLQDARGRTRRVRRGKTVDVEDAASRRPVRDRRAARPDQAPDPPGDGVAGRHSQLLHPRIAAQARRRARPLPGHRNRGRQARQLSFVLRRILRHRSFRHDRRDRGNGAGRLLGNGWRSRPPRARLRTKAASCFARSAAAAATAMAARSAHRRSRVSTASRCRCPTAAA